MKIARGQSRTVLIFESFVIKFPRIYFWQAIKSIWRSYQKGYLLKCLQFDVYTYASSPRRFLFRGIIDNRGEYYFYRQSWSPFLMPTIFSLFGLLNIQKRGDKTNIDVISLWCQLCELTNNEVWVNSHTFANSKNFCEENGRLKIIDYGDYRIHEILEKYGDKIFENFDLKQEDKIKSR